jgi:iron complex transport system substrate-binding protein
VKRSALIWLCWLIAHCASGATIVDDSGNPVSLQPTAQRIVTLSPHATELVVAAGAQSRLVAAASEGIELPPQVQRLNTLGGVDRERLLALRPDLVIGWSSGNRPGDLAWIRAQGIRLYESEPKNLTAIAATLRDIGRLANTQASADAAADAFEYRVDHACDGRHGTQTVYVAVWDKPAMTLGGRHWLNDVLRRTHRKNLYQWYPRSVFPIESEARAMQRRVPTLNLSDGSSLSGLLARPGPHLADAIAALCRESDR